jgi:hypothetical protein
MSMNYFESNWLLLHETLARVFPADMFIINCSSSYMLQYAVEWWTDENCWIHDLCFLVSGSFPAFAEENRDEWDVTLDGFRSWHDKLSKTRYAPAVCKKLLFKTMIKHFVIARWEKSWSNFLQSSSIALLNEAEKKLPEIIPCLICY